MFSIVSIYNNIDILNRFLIKSLQVQSVEYELILMDNRDGQFKSAAEGLNAGARRATGKYIIFVHQDVEFSQPDWLEQAEKLLDELPDLGVAGVAGISEAGRNLKERGRNIIRHTEDKRVWELANPIEKPEVIQTLDCCLLIVPGAVFNQLQFDEVTCNNWHLYGEDYCLSCTSLGLKAYVIPMSIYHYSGGNFFTSNRVKILLRLGPLTGDFYEALKPFISKHKKSYRYIYTCNGEWNTFQPVLRQRISKLVASACGLLKRAIIKERAPNKGANEVNR